MTPVSRSIRFRTFSMRRWGGVLSLVAVAICIGVFWPIALQAGTAPSLHLLVKSEAERLSLHEPVFLEISIHNAQKAPQTVDFGGNCEDNIRLTVTHPDGSTQQLLPPSVPGGGIALDCQFLLGPGEAYRFRLLLNRWLTVWPEGSYRLAVSTVGGLEGSTTLDIGPRDLARLTEACLQLEKAVGSRLAEYVQTAVWAIETLSDEACLNSLVRLLQGSFHGREPAIKSLSRLGSSEALDALVRVWPELKADQQALAVESLAANGHLQAFKLRQAQAELSREQ